MNRGSDDRESTGCTRRGFLAGGFAAGAVVAAGTGGFYFGYKTAMGKPVRVGVIGTGDEGNVLLGAMNPKFLEVCAIADARPYSVYRAFHGEIGVPSRPGLLSVYGWKSESEARKHVKVYSRYEELLENAEKDSLDGVVIALPLFLHAPVAIAAMRRGLHVLTEKLMGHSVHECKEMARTAATAGVLLATGHQRHYNILYAQAAEKIRRGQLGDLHYIRAQWHRSNLPGKDSWQQPLPPGITDDEKTNKLAKDLKKAQEELKTARGPAIEKAQKQVRQLQAQIADKLLHIRDREVVKPLRGTAAGEIAEQLVSMTDSAGRTPAEAYGYLHRQIPSGGGKVYDRPAIEELIRWRLWDRTAAGLMAELGSHQLDASSIFIAAAHEGKKQHPLTVAAAANRPVFPLDRDCEDHVFCILEFPAPGYDKKDPNKECKKIGVMYSSINGNGYGGYGEIVYGTKGTLILEREQVLQEPSSGAEIKVSTGGAAGPTLNTQASGPAPKLVAANAGEVSRGYAEELEHWAWCISNPAPENRPRCHPEVALGDAVIALVTNKAAREGRRIEFNEEWFKIDSNETPEGVAPDVSRYTA